MNKYIRAVSSNYIFFFINTVFFLGITPVAIHVMGDELYGIWSILNSILIFSGVGMLGMGGIVNKFASEENQITISPSSIISSAIVILLPIALLVMLILLLLRGWIADQFDLEPNLRDQFRHALVFTAISVLPSFLGRIPQGYMLSQLKNTLVRSIDLGVNILVWIGSVWIAFLGQGLSWMTLWGLMVIMIGTSILFLVLNSSINFKWQIQMPLIKRMMNFSGFSFIESIAIVLFQHFDRILVGLVLGPAATGVYSVGTSVGLRITMVVGQASEVMIPYASLTNSRNDHKQLYRTYRRLVRYVSVIVALISGILLLWIPEILVAWISPSFSERYSFVFRIIILFYGLFTLCHPGRQTLVGIGKIKFVSLIYLASSIFMLFALYFLSLQFGIVGTALANGVMVFLLTFSFFAYKYLQPKKYLVDFIRDIGVGFVVPLVVFILMYWTEYLPVKVTISIFGMCGLGFLSYRTVIDHVKRSQ